MPPKPTLATSGGNQCGGLEADFLPRPGTLPAGWAFSSVLFKCCWNVFDDYQCGWQDANISGGNIPGLTPSDFTCKRWSPSRLVCDNLWLGVGAVPRPWDHPYFYTPNTGTVDLGCTTGGVNYSSTGLVADNRHIAVSGYTLNNDIDQACGDVVGHRDYHYKSGTGADFAWDGATIDTYNASHGTSYSKSVIGSVRLYYMNVVLGIPGTTLPFPVSSDYPWWIFGKPVFADSTGSLFPIARLWNCIRTADAYNGFGGGIISTFNECIGCPYIFTEQNRGSGTVTFEKFSTYNLTGAAPTKSNDNRFPCYLPVIGPTCPPHSTIDGTGKCQPDCVTPKCADPAVYNPTTHNCEAQGGPLWLYPQFISWCRGVSGKKYFAASKLITDRLAVVGSKPFVITFYDDNRPETSAGTFSICTQAGDTTACASIFCPPGSDILQIFFIRGRPSLGQGTLLDTFEVCYLESRDSGRSVKDRITNLTPFPAPLPAVMYNDATMVGITSSVSGNTVSAIQVMDSTGYDKIRPYIEKSGRLVLFCYRNNNWYCRVGYQDQVQRTWSLSGENLVCSTKDYTWEQLSENADGSFEFYYYNDDGMLIQLLCQSIDPDGLGIWGQKNLLDASGTGLEYYTMSALHDKKSNDGISLLFWTPNQRGPVNPTTFTNLGKLVFRTIRRGASGSSFPASFPVTLGQDYILGPENNVVLNTNWNAMGTIRKRRDGAIEHQGVGLYKRVKDLSNLGAGNWGNTN